MKKAVFGFLILLKISSYAIASDTAPTGREGNGGNDDGVRVAAIADNVFKYLKKVDSIAPFSSIDLAKLTKIFKNIKYVMSDKPLYLTFERAEQECLAVNVMQGSKPLITIDQSRWDTITDENLKSVILLHELLGLIGAEQTGDYRFSSVYLNMLEKEPPADLLDKTFFPNTYSLQDFLANYADDYKANTVTISPVQFNAMGFLAYLNSEDEKNGNSSELCHFLGYTGWSSSVVYGMWKDAASYIFFYVPSDGKYPLGISIPGGIQKQSITNPNGKYMLSEIQTNPQSRSQIGFFKQITCTR